MLVPIKSAIEVLHFTELSVTVWDIVTFVMMDGTLTSATSC